MTQASVDTVQNSVSAHFQRPTLARSTVDSNQSGALCVAAAIVRRQLTLSYMTVDFFDEMI